MIQHAWTLNATTEPRKLHQHIKYRNCFIQCVVVQQGHQWVLRITLFIVCQIYCCRFLVATSLFWWKKIVMISVVFFFSFSKWNLKGLMQDPSVGIKPSCLSLVNEQLSSHWKVCQFGALNLYNLVHGGTYIKLSFHVTCWVQRMSLFCWWKLVGGQLRPRGMCTFCSWVNIWGITCALFNR